MFLIVWGYNNTGRSVFAAAVAVMVTVVWGPQTLARQKND